MRIAAAVSSALLLSVLSATDSRAAWPTPPFSSLPVCTAVNQQRNPWIVADGAGGTFITWEDSRASTQSINNTDIYVQHVLASGVVDPTWPVNGRAVVMIPYDQLYPKLVADGVGGAIVVWSDNRSGTNFDIYAGHVLASGAVDPAWPVNGRALCTAPDKQDAPSILADGAGGALVLWGDKRAGDFDVYAHHVLANGVADPSFPINGRAICTAAGDQYFATFVADGAGGALASWQSWNGVDTDSYVAHLMSSGTLDPAWPSSGLAVCALPGGQGGMVMMPDGAGGAIVTWSDGRDGELDVYAHHVLASGVVDPAWPATGRAICTAPDGQGPSGLVSDGAGGAIITWEDNRASTQNIHNTDIYAQHLLGSGDVDPVWPVNGRALCLYADDQFNPRPVPDGAGGALVVWGGFQFGNRYVFVQRVSASGTLEPGWAANGEPVTVLTNSPGEWRAIPDGLGSVIVTWTDSRNGEADIYAQRMTPPDGVVAAVGSLVSAHWTGAAAELAWQGDALAGAQVTVYREEDRSGWAQVATVTGDGQGFARYTDPNVAAGREYGYRIGMPLDGTEVFVGETRIAIPAVGLAIQAVSPNPARGGRLGLRATFAGSEPARARVLDLSGRVVLERDVATGSGNAELDLGGATLRPGVYVLELVQGGERATKRFTYLK